MAFAASAALTLFVSTAHAQSPDSVRPESHHINLDEVVVTSSPLARALGRSISAASVLRREELAERLESSIGETLRLEPGITTSFFGPGASRPIIRGLGGDRIRVLVDGIGSFDAAQTSPDHAVPVEPALAQRIEVFRGPASLLYGSSAAGGVVNTITGKIPEAAPEGGFEAAARYSYSTVNEANEIAGGFDALVGKLVFHGEGFFRDADDYEIPGLNASDALLAEEAEEAAEHGEVFDPDEEFTRGFVDNTDFETKGGAGGVSWIIDSGGYDGFLGFSVSTLDSNYGIPAGVHGHGEEGDHEDEEYEEDGHEDEENVRIDLKQVRYDLKGELNGDLWIFERAKLRLGYGDYRHFELEGDEIGTSFENDEVEGRLDLVAKSYGAFGGRIVSAIGAQGRFRDFTSVGAEAFVPPSEQTQIGVFALKELTKGNWIADFAARYEYVKNETDMYVAEEDGAPVAVENKFDAFSVSGGIGWQATEALFFGVDGFRTERAPSLEEQFSFGPHLATQSFEVGDPTLGKEVANGVEATIRGAFGPLTLVVNGFYTNYDDFIFERETGEVLDGLPVFAFTAVDATFRGFEAEIDLDIGEAIFSNLGPVGFALHAQADLVRATSSDFVNKNLPRIPSFSSLVGFSATHRLVDFHTELEYVAAQNKTADFELSTGDHVFVNLFLTVRPLAGRRDIALEIRARNVNNAEGRSHTSFLKDTTPLPGRDVRVAIRAGF